MNSDHELAKSAGGTRATRTRYYVLLWLLLAATIAYMGRNCLGVAVADEGVKSELLGLGVDAKEIKWVLSTFYLAYALAQIPSGWLGHAWGIRIVLPVIALMWSIACAAIGTSNGFLARWTRSSARNRVLFERLKENSPKTMCWGPCAML